jgi:hypothetical protein
MIKPRLALGRLKTFFDRPTQSGDGGEFVQFREVRPERHVEGHISRIGDRAADQYQWSDGGDSKRNRRSRAQS